MSRGAEFRSRFLEEFEEPELLYATLLEAVCSSLGLIERLETDIEVNGLKTLGSTGQEIVNPSIPELRHQRQALARLLKELDLADAPTTSRSEAGRNLARARWSA